MSSIKAVLCFVVILGCFGVMSDQALSDAPPAPAPPLRSLHQFCSINGLLTATLIASPQTVDMGSFHFTGLTYDGDYAGPLLCVHPGDVMHIRLINRLADPTNLHFHGLETSPLNNGDNMDTVVHPGQAFDYEIKISPTQSPGLYWYHPHTHGLSSLMVNGGLSGALLVEGLTHQIPDLAHIKEQVMIFKLYETDDATNPALHELHGLVQTINGQLRSTLMMHKGETQLWQILNTGPDTFIHIALKGHTFRLIGRDGVTTNQETIVDHLDVGPGSRVAVLVNAGDQAGSFDIVSDHMPTGWGAAKTNDRVLGSVLVDNGIPVAPVPTLTSFPPKLDLSRHTIDARRTFTFTEDVAKDAYYINNKLFDHDRVDTRVPLGHVEEWTIRNETDDLHVFHIHQMHFQVLSINGEIQPFDGYLDTIKVPEHGEVKLIMPFTDPAMVGRFVYHCHVLTHQDRGMMGVIEVYDPKKENPDVSLWQRLLPHLPCVDPRGLSPPSKLYVQVTPWARYIQDGEVT